MIEKFSGFIVGSIPIAAAIIGIYFAYTKATLKITYHSMISSNKQASLTVINKRDNYVAIYYISCVINNNIYILKEWLQPQIIPPYGILNLDVNSIPNHSYPGKVDSSVFFEKEKKLYANIGKRFLKLKEENIIDINTFAERNKIKIGFEYYGMKFGIPDIVDMDYKITFNEDSYIPPIYISKDGYVFSADSNLSILFIKEYSYETFPIDKVLDKLFKESIFYASLGNEIIEKITNLRKEITEKNISDIREDFIKEISKSV